MHFSHTICQLILLLIVGFPVAKVTYYVTIMAASCSAIISVSYGTITLLLRDTVCSANLSQESVSSKC